MRAAHSRPALPSPGGITKEQLEAVLGQPVLPPSQAVRAPGMLESHYAPRAGLLLVAPSELVRVATERAAGGAKVAVLSAAPLTLPAGAERIEIPADAAELARVLYATLRALDERGFDVAVASLPPEAGLGLAVRDRLKRAAGPR